MSESLEFNHVTFAVPARRFAIDSFVTVQDRLPIVIEFALRLIRLVGEVSLEDFQNYFGFTERESRALLDALEAQRLVLVEEDKLRLTEYAVSRFDESSDDLPRFTAVEPRSDVVDFEMLAFSPIKGGNGLPYLRNLLEVGLSDGDAVSNSNSLAEHAFQESFSDIARMRRWRGAEKIDVYKVSHVEAKSDFFVPVPMRLRIDEDAGYVREPESTAADTPEVFWDRLAERVPSLLPKVDAAAQRQHMKRFAEVFGDHVIPQFMTLAGFDLQRYSKQVIENREIGYGADTEPVFGNLYLGRNRKLLDQWLRAAWGHSGGFQKYWSSALWYAPNYAWWGRTGLLEDTYRQFEGLIRGKGLSDALGLVVQGTLDQKFSMESQYFGTSIRDIHIMAPVEEFGGRLEVFFVPARMACVLFHFNVPKAPYMWAPVGFVTSNPLRVEAARRFLQIATAEDRLLRTVPRKTPENERKLTWSEVSAALDYVPVLESNGKLQPLSL